MIRQKLAIFSFQSQFSRSKINLIFLKMIFLYEYQIRRTSFTGNIFYFNHFKNILYLVKMCPIFASSPFLFAEYQNRRTNINNTFDFIHSENFSFSKNVPNFWRLTPKLCYQISRNPLRMFIWMQKAIEFYLKHYEILQLLLR